VDVPPAAEAAYRRAIVLLVTGVLLLAASLFVGEATLNLIRPLGLIGLAFSVIFAFIGLWLHKQPGAPADDDR
jgi:hypothetical protein